MADIVATTALTPRPDPTPDSWYVTRRDALMDGDPGLLPDGSTCVEQRTEYADIAVESVTPAATLDSIVPAAATVGGADFTLQAIGTNFIDGDLIVLNGLQTSTVFVSVTELSTQVTGATLAAGAVPVLVRRGSIDTAPLNLTVS